jgi:hypothetical protein
LLGKTNDPQTPESLERELQPAHVHALALTAAPCLGSCSPPVQPHWRPSEPALRAP